MKKNMFLFCFSNIFLDPSMKRPQVGVSQPLVSLSSPLFSFTVFILVWVLLPGLLPHAVTANHQGPA